MAYQLSYQEQAGVLKVTVLGERVRGKLVRDAQEGWTEIARTCHEKGLKKILIVSHATGAYPITDAYQINANLDRFGVQKDWQIAFVSRDTDSIEGIQFAETVARNRGMNVRLFTSENEAWDWISS